jgi:hypothetical protein
MERAKSMTGLVNGVIVQIQEKNSVYLLVLCYSPPATCNEENVSWTERLLFIIYKDMGRLHASLLLHMTVSWSSRGKVLMGVFELQAEVTAF